MDEEKKKNEKELIKKQRRKEKCAKLEKKYPKIRVNMNVYNRLNEIKQQFNLNSLGDVICILIEAYHSFL